MNYLKKIYIAYILHRNTKNANIRPDKNFTKRALIYTLIGKTHKTRLTKDEENKIECWYTYGLLACIEYLNNVNFSPEKWLLREVPISYQYYYFVNFKESKEFTLVIDEDDEAVIPSYLDDDCYGHRVSTIQEAINNCGESYSNEPMTKKELNEFRNSFGGYMNSWVKNSCYIDMKDGKIVTYNDLEENTHYIFILRFINTTNDEIISHKSIEKNFEIIPYIKINIAKKRYLELDEISTYECLTIKDFKENLKKINWFFYRIQE